MNMPLLDTDFIISLSFSIESTHEQAKLLAKKYLSINNAYYLDLVLHEVATVVSKKHSHKKAVEICSVMRKNASSVLKLSPNDELKTWDFFNSQKNKNISFVDCANVVIAKKLGLKILSFDKFYDKFEFTL
ncbi:MAG: hypothetical protein COZ34_02140 [Candidatus Pacebacteria bacterium CG_4_10_14_3_um_filter_34_15]|nr:type II toxin-antitoxin system VapC family toxin [Candidatus Paceibacterota bacterium]PIQ81249.1 MAG: hypothetical protein COV78_01275 [Candidatus Pacebacteria bacterium CG11_big_fil_rev_8_21_14_0_20_34_55]PIX81660.1 MAG: hypothetical protein COZ34_02140 [Candidatus Pacebacteria bacterium CG_4_10_14_3_um_filter_34_15]